MRRKERKKKTSKIMKMKSSLEIINNFPIENCSNSIAINNDLPEDTVNSYKIKKNIVIDEPQHTARNSLPEFKDKNLILDLRKKWSKEAKDKSESNCYIF